MLANIFKILSSQSVTKSEFLECNFWILPYIGFTSLVIFSAAINWFKLFNPEVELYKPEYINPYFLCSSLYSWSKVVEALTPFNIMVNYNYL